MYSQNPNAYGQHPHAEEAQPPYSDNTNPPPVVATGFPVGSQPLQPQGSRVPWSTGLCDCFSDVRNCCITCWCPCITFGQIAEIVDEGETSGTASGAIYAVIAATTGHACMYSCLYRSKIREKYRLEENPCDDCLVHYCCEHCSLCQEYRELQNRGFNMVMGWRGNLEVEQRNRGVAMMPTATSAPPVEQGMKR